jgi:Putative prokaryotic signal transducing protein
MEADSRDRRRERLVRVAVADNTFTAEFLKQQLREAGIRSLVRNREGGSGVVGAIGGTFEVFVLEGDADLASHVLGGPPPEPLAPPALPAPKRVRRRWWR